MVQQDYQCSIMAPVSAEEAFEGISQVSGWWAKHFEGYAGSLHDVFTVRFGKTYVTFELTELVLNRRVVWLVTDCHLHWIAHKTEWTGTSILWEITPTSEGVRIDMTHRGLIPEVECFGDCQVGWNHHIGNSLKKYLTEHVGMPE
jgi:hypothetical protein